MICYHLESKLIVASLCWTMSAILNSHFQHDLFTIAIADVPDEETKHTEMSLFSGKVLALTWLDAHHFLASGPDGVSVWKSFMNYFQILIASYKVVFEVSEIITRMQRNYFKCLICYTEYVYFFLCHFFSNPIGVLRTKMFIKLHLTKIKLYSFTY